MYQYMWIGRNGTTHVHCKLFEISFFCKIHFRNYSVFKNHYRKFQIKICTRTHLFSRTSRPHSKRKCNLHKFHAIPTTLLGAHCSFLHEYARFTQWQLQQLSKLGVTTLYCTTLSTTSYRLLVFDALFWRDLSC